RPDGLRDMNSSRFTDSLAHPLIQQYLQKMLSIIISFLPLCQHAYHNGVSQELQNKTHCPTTLPHHAAPPRCPTTLLQPHLPKQGLIFTIYRILELLYNL